MRACHTCTNAYMCARKRHEFPFACVCAHARFLQACTYSTRKEVHIYTHTQIEKAQKNYLAQIITRNFILHTHTYIQRHIFAHTESSRKMLAEIMSLRHYKSSNREIQELAHGFESHASVSHKFKNDVNSDVAGSRAQRAHSDKESEAAALRLEAGRKTRDEMMRSVQRQVCVYARMRVITFSHCVHILTLCVESRVCTGRYIAAYIHTYIHTPTQIHTYTRRWVT